MLSVGGPNFGYDHRPAVGCDDRAVGKDVFCDNRHAIGANHHDVRRFEVFSAARSNKLPM
jgi:hypothetical protein